MDEQIAKSGASVYAHGAGDGRLTFVEGVPILRVGGSAKEIGRQVADIALRPAARLLNYPTDYLRAASRAIIATTHLVARQKAVRKVISQFPRALSG